MPTVHIGDIPVGPEHPPVLMAEIGTFFNQDIPLALEYISHIAKHGVPVLKTEILHSAEVCLSGTGLSHTYSHSTGTTTEDYRKLIERKTVPLADYARILQHCHDLAIPVAASVYDIAGINFFVEHGGAAIKIARNNVDNIPLIRHAASTTLPIIFDTGDVTLEELARAVNTVQAVRKTSRTDNKDDAAIIINHHPAMNPAPANVHNMRCIPTYAAMFRCPVGLACHYRGNEMMYVAVAMGASLIEKGIDRNPERAEQDIASAASFAELPEILQGLQRCWESLGGPARDAVPRLTHPQEIRSLNTRQAERTNEPVDTLPLQQNNTFSVRIHSTGPIVRKDRDLTTRACLSAKRTLHAGDVIATDTVNFSFPPVGISVADWDSVQGRALAATVEKGQPVRYADLKEE